MKKYLWILLLGLISCSQENYTTSICKSTFQKIGAYQVECDGKEVIEYKYFQKIINLDYWEVIDCEILNSDVSVKHWDWEFRNQTLYIEIWSEDFDQYPSISIKTKYKNL